MQSQSTELILQRIEAIMRELESLRKIVLTAQIESPQENLAQKLFGILGQGNWDEYDSDLDWQRFEA